MGVTQATAVPSRYRKPSASASQPYPSGLGREDCGESTGVQDVERTVGISSSPVSPPYPRAAREGRKTQCAARGRDRPLLVKRPRGQVILLDARRYPTGTSRTSQSSGIEWDLSGARRKLSAQAEVHAMYTRSRLVEPTAASAPDRTTADVWETGGPDHMSMPC